MGGQSRRERILSVLPDIVRFLIRCCEFEPGTAVALNDLLDNARGLGNGLRGTLKFKEKSVLDWIRSLDYAGCVDGRHHYGSYMSDEQSFT